MSGQMPPGGSPQQGIPGAGQQPGQQPGQPSEEEVREYVNRMRGAHVEQVVTELIQALLNSAQVKLGRRDARFLIDLAETMAQETEPHLSPQVTEQIEQVLGQLRMGQVEAENELEEAREAGEDVSEPNDLGSPPTAAESPGETTSDADGGDRGAPPPGRDRSPGSQLWTPGS